MFGKSRRELEDVVTHARTLVDSDNLIEMQRVVALARELMVGIVGPAFDAEVIVHLEDRIELMLQQRIAQSLRPCANCTGTVFRISHQHGVASLGRCRVVVCNGCGHVATYVDRVDELPKHFGPPVEAPPFDGGPFR